MKKSIILAVLVFLSTLSTYANQITLSGNYAQFSASDEYGETSTLLPAIGFILQTETDYSVFLETGYFNYEIEISGDRRDKVLSWGEVQATGYTMLGGLLWKLDTLDFRIGLGSIQYDYKNEVSPELQSFIAQYYGIFDYREEVQKTVGTQWALGVEFPLSPELLLGLDYRSVTVKPDVNWSLTESGIFYSGSEQADFSHTWLTLRLVYKFDV